MKANKLFRCVLGVSLLAVAGIVEAQAPSAPYTPPKLGDNEFLNAASDRVVAGEGISSVYVGGWQGLGHELQGSGNIGGIGNPNAYCPPEKPNCVDEHFANLKSQQKIVGSAVGLNPSDGVVSISRAMNYANIGSSNLTGAMNLWYVVLNLLDPAVGGGSAMANQLAAQYTNLHYGAENATRLAMAGNPKLAPYLNALYDDCLKKSNATSPWTKNQANCLGVQPIAQITSVAWDNTGIDSGARASDSEDHAWKNADAAVALGIGNPVQTDVGQVFGNKLSAIIFMQEMQAILRDTGLDAAYKADLTKAMKSFYNSWLDYIGDIEILNLPKLQNGVIPLASNIQELKIKRIEPRIGAQRFQRRLLERTYNELNRSLYKYCLYKNGEPMAEKNDLYSALEVTEGDANLLEVSGINFQQGKTTDPFDWMANVDGVPTNKGADFWKDQISQKSYQRLSFDGFTATPLFLEGAFRFMESDIVGGPAGAVGTAEISIHGGLKYNCKDLRVWKSDNPFNLSKVIQAQKDLDVLKSDSAQDRVRIYFLLSQRIMAGQWLASLVEAKRFVDKLTGGSVDPVIQDLAYQLINQAAGTDDVEGLFKTVRDQMRSGTQALFASVSNSTKGARVLSDAFGQSSNSGSNGARVPFNNG